MFRRLKVSEAEAKIATSSAPLERAAADGVVEAVHCAVGDTVADGALLVEFTPGERQPEGEQAHA